MYQKMSLKRTDFQSVVSQSFRVLRREEDFYDVTLVSDDQTQISAHKLVLSASSDFFRNILRKNKHSHPLIYLSGVKAQNLQCILDYIYLGEVKVFQGQLDEFLESAHKLNIRGLATVQTEDTGVKEEIQEIDPPAYDVDVTEEETRQERMVMKAEMKSVTQKEKTVEYESVDVDFRFLKSGNNEEPSRKRKYQPGEKDERFESSQSPFLSYHYFEKVQDDDQVKCNICSKLINRKGGNTSGMNYHLRSRHSEQYSKFLECKAETEKDRATKSTEKKKKADGDGLNQLKLNKSPEVTVFSHYPASYEPQCWVTSQLLSCHYN